VDDEGLRVSGDLDAEGAEAGERGLRVSSVGVSDDFRVAVAEGREDRGAVGDRFISR
jgi:hypothetical protein